jgi:hypothetical protein
MLWWVAGAAFADEPVVFAVRDLYPGLAIEPGDVEVVQVSEAERAAAPAAVFPDAGALIGRIPRMRVLTGEPVRPEHLVDPLRYPEDGIPGGHRAFLVAGERAAAGAEVDLVVGSGVAACRLYRAVVLEPSKPAGVVVTAPFAVWTMVEGARPAVRAVAADRPQPEPLCR